LYVGSAEKQSLSAREAAKPQSELQHWMSNGVAHNLICVTGKRRATQIVRPEERAGLHGVVGLFQKEVRHTVMR